MSALSQALTDYLATRRALGFKLEREAQLLAQFVGYCESRHVDRVTTELAMAWAIAPAEADPSWWAQRMSAVRTFARWLSTIDPGTEVPPADVLPARSRRAIPYLYSDHDIAALMTAAQTIASPLKAATYSTLIGLLAVTGMRIGEAIAADHDDIDLGSGLLVVRVGKFGKQRQLHLHPTTCHELNSYVRVRDRLCRYPASSAFFVSTVGTRLIYKNVHRQFHHLVGQAGLQPRSGRCRPRLHDLRHTFAVNTLLAWYRSGGDVQARLPQLSTWLGHVDPANTYWYLQATPELLALVAERLDHARGVRQ